MIKSLFGITKEPFNRSDLSLLPQQQEALDMIRIHAQQGGFSVITGQPGVGKTVLREHIEALAKERDIVVVSCARTLHTYINILKQLAQSLKIDVPTKDLEKELILIAFHHVKERKTLYTVIDEAHLLDMQVLRKLRLLFEKFPRKHNLVLLGQRDLLYYLSMNINEDIKSRITYSTDIKGLNDEQLQGVIHRELETVKLGANTFDESAMELIIRSAKGNLRLCRNVCYGSLIDAARQNTKIVSIRHVNAVLVQPHWRSHEELITQQTA